MNIQKYTTRIFIMCLLMLSATLISCDDTSNNPPTDPNENLAIGTYTVGDQEIDILSGFWIEDESYYTVKFSPLECEFNKASTYFIFSMSKQLVGKEYAVDNMFQNDDYVFIYQTPAHLYSQFKKLNSGTMFFQKTGDNTFKLKLDTKLYDGTPFKIDFEGDLISVN